VLWVDLFDIVDDVIVQRLAEQFVRATQQSEAQLEQSCCRNETLTTQHHQRLTERLKHGMNVRTFLDHTTRWRKIKSPYMKITISEKYVNIFSPNVAYFCSIQLCTDFVALCCTYLMYAKLTETQLSRTNFPNWTKGMAQQALPTVPRLHWQGLLATQQPRPKPPQLPRVGSHVGEVPGAEFLYTECFQTFHCTYKLFFIFEVCYGLVLFVLFLGSY